LGFRLQPKSELAVTTPSTDAYTMPARTALASKGIHMSITEPSATTALFNSTARTATDVESIKQSILDHVCYSQGRTPAQATTNDWYIAVALTVRDRTMQRVVRTIDTIASSRHKTVCYLSAEFLLGPHLENNLVSLGIRAEVARATAELGPDLDTLIEQEEEPGLGNGGLGRLAACYLDSLSALEIPAIGYGIRYEFGIFDQAIRDGRQIEITDKWLHLGNPGRSTAPRPRCA
jgi:glycogen phosphorylase